MRGAAGFSGLPVSGSGPVVDGGGGCGGRSGFRPDFALALFAFWGAEFGFLLFSGMGRSRYAKL